MSLKGTLPRSPMGQWSPSDWDSIQWLLLIFVFGNVPNWISSVGWLDSERVRISDIQRELGLETLLPGVSWGGSVMWCGCLLGPSFRADPEHAGENAYLIWLENARESWETLLERGTLLSLQPLRSRWQKVLFVAPNHSPSLFYLSSCKHQVWSDVSLYIWLFFFSSQHNKTAPRMPRVQYNHIKFSNVWQLHS